MLQVCILKRSKSFAGSLPFHVGDRSLALRGQRSVFVCSAWTDGHPNSAIDNRISGNENAINQKVAASQTRAEGRSANGCV